MALLDFLKRKKEKEGRESLPSMTKVLSSEAKVPLIGAVSERMLADVIRPHVTERSRQNSQRGVYMFRVSEEATKHTIKRAIEALYRVAVERVRVMRIPSKPRRRGLTRGTKKGYKKAAVTLRKGEHIDLFS